MHGVSTSSEMSWYVPLIHHVSNLASFSSCFGTRLELDHWCNDEVYIFQMLQAEFGQSRIRLSERHQVELHRERQQ